jgi:hypothetical protein
VVDSEKLIIFQSRRVLKIAHDVFICHSSQDKTIADAVCATLENQKIRCWIAPRDVTPGIPYAEALIDALNNSRVMVLVFSSRSNDSPQVMREVERAVNKGVPIIPFRIENVLPSKSLEYFLSAPHWLDALSPPLELHLQELTSTVEKLLGKTNTTEPVVTLQKTISKTKRFTVKPVFIASGIGIILIAVIGILFSQGVFLASKDNTLTDTQKTLSPSGTTIETSITTKPITTTVATTSGPHTSTIKTITGILDNSSELTSGVSTQGSLNKGETKFYTFDAKTGDAVYAVLSEGETNSPMNPELALLGPDGNQIVGNYSTTSYNIDQAINVSGKYTLRVKDASNVGGKYVLSFMQLSKPVNSLTSGVSVEGQLQVPGDVNWYTFDAEVGDTVFTVLSEGITNSPMNPELSLLGPNGIQIIGNYSTTSYNIDQAINVPGKYTLRVKDASNVGGKYVLSFMQLSKPVNPLTSGVSVEGQLQVPGDVNWYTFDAEVGDAVFTVLSEGITNSPMNPELSLLGPNGIQIIGNYSTTSYNIEQAINVPGKYTLRLKDASNVGGKYVLSFMQLSKPVNSLTSGVSVEGQLQVPGDVNWYTFDAEAGDAVYVVLSEGITNSSMNPELALLGPDGIQIIGNYSTTSYNIERAIGTSGKYTLRVKDASNVGGKYVLSFSLIKK